MVLTQAFSNLEGWALLYQTKKLFILISLLPTLKSYTILFYCFYCLLRTSICPLGLRSGMPSSHSHFYKIMSKESASLSIQVLKRKNLKQWFCRKQSQWSNACFNLIKRLEQHLYISYSSGWSHLNDIYKCNSSLFIVFEQIFDHCDCLQQNCYSLCRLTFFLKCKYSINPITANVPHHIETSQLIWNANQLTGFYMMENIGR